ncbi:unnamed protein product [Adineta steineri]|uniref:Uncharacterized protein n=1 Tax=Adineta steineri TaxID=433720 RepID=A0A819L183_9BILA|nr:unnamed protein product [Adineta steineri]
MSFEQRIKKESERFQTLFNHISDTQWSAAAMPEAQSRLTTCQRQTRLTQVKIDTFKAIADKEHKRFLNIKKHNIKHAWHKFRGTLEQSLDEQEKIWLRELKKYQEEEQHLIVLKEEMNSAEKHMQQCQDTYNDHTTTKRELNELLDDLFSDVTSSYSNEDILKHNLEIKKECLINLQNNERILKHVFHLLKKTSRALTISHRALNHALNMKTCHLFSYCCFANMAINSYFTKAQDQSIQAQQLLTEAKRIYSNLLSIDNRHMTYDNSLFNTMFGNICLDTNIRKMTEESSNRLTCADTVLVSILLQIKEQVGKCEGDRDRTNKDIKRLAGEYFTARIDIIRNIIESLNSNSTT